ncbi:MAG: N-acetyltransferase, partial [Bacteroidetes bacterium]|nr:N-acetyltransferase [Bacteroidota bacterium]
MPVSPTAQIDPSARVEENVSVGHFSVIDSDVRIGVGSQIGHHVVIHASTVVGDGVRIDDHAVLGKQPMRAARSATTSASELPPAHIGNRSLIGAG